MVKSKRCRKDQEIWQQKNQGEKRDQHQTLKQRRYSQYHTKLGQAKNNFRHNKSKRSSKANLFLDWIGQDLDLAQI